MGSIITFYSYKGGTGRSMALANAGVLLSRSEKKTLLIDWDLEAPGLHKYFGDLFQIKDIDNFPGLIDYFIKFQQLLGTSSTKSPETKEILHKKLKLKEFILETKIPNLSILKAGAFDNKYPERINTIKWEGIFHKAEDVFLHFRDILTAKFDYVLIDSRTGYTDSSGICTMLLPEKVVLVFTPNSQSLNGVIQLMEKASKYRLNSSDLQSLMFYPLPSRIENAEKELREKWRLGINGYQPSFEKVFDMVYGMNGTDLNHYFNEVQIQHEPKFAYGEQIAVLNEKSKDRLSLSESYNKFLSRLIGEEPIWSTKVNHTRRIYVSYEEDVAKFAKDLISTLSKKGFIVQQQPESSAGTSGFSFSNISKEISEAEILMPIVSEASLKSKFSKLELSIFLEQKRLYSKQILPVKVAANIPVEIEKEMFIEGRDRNVSRAMRLIEQSLTSKEAISKPKEKKKPIQANFKKVPKKKK